jgi:hypothetical protein
VTDKHERGTGPSELAVDERDEVPVVEVRVFRHGALVHRELCESEDRAALVVDEWSELDGVRCEVDDLSIRHEPGQVLEPEPSELPEEGYRDQVELDDRARRER